MKFALSILKFRYRLVPEAHFPEQINDVYSATRYFLQPEILSQYSVDPNRIAVSGDSAGGNLAAAVCQQVNYILHKPHSSHNTWANVLLLITTIPPTVMFQYIEQVRIFLGDDYRWSRYPWRPTAQEDVGRDEEQ